MPTRNGALHDGNIEDLIYSNQRLGECIVKKNTELDQLRKQVRRIMGRGDFLQRFLTEAIMQTLSEKEKNGTGSNSAILTHMVSMK